MLIRADLILCEGENITAAEALWSESCLNDFSEWRKTELRRGGSNLVKENKMLKTLSVLLATGLSQKLPEKNNLFEVRILQGK